MKWEWASSLDQIWHSPAFPMWATLAAAAFFALVVLIVLLRADKTMANGALSVIALLAIGIASTTTVRGLGVFGRTSDPVVDTRPAGPLPTPIAALACLDGLAGDSVEVACERAVFASADSTAAAVSYAAAQISRVSTAASARSLTPEQQVVKRAVERDRYGLVAQVLTTRERCILTDCPIFRALSDANQIKANISERRYDTLVAQYSPAWTTAKNSQSWLAAVPPNVPTGKPSSIEFPNAASIPSVSIMTAEPPAPPVIPPAAARAPATSNAQAPPARAPAAPKKQQSSSAPPPQQAAGSGPTRLTPSLPAPGGRASAAPSPAAPRSAEDN